MEQNKERNSVMSETAGENSRYDEMINSVDQLDQSNFVSNQIHSSNYSLKIVVHNYSSNVDLTVANDVIENRARSLLNRRLKSQQFEAFQVKVEEGKFVPQTSSVDVSLRIRNDHLGNQISDIEQELIRTWCNVDDDRHLWLEVNQSLPSNDSLKIARHSITISQMSLGTFPSTGAYNEHWTSEYYTNNDQGLSYVSSESESEDDDEDPSSVAFVLNEKLVAHFEHDMKSFKVVHIDDERLKWTMEISYDSLEKFFLLCTKDSTHHLYIFMKHPPKMYKTVPKKHNFYSYKIIQEKKRNSSFSTDDIEQDDVVREVRFATCPKEVIGSSNVLQVKLSTNEINIKHVMLRFAKIGFSLITANPEIFNFKGSDSEAVPVFEQFETNFALFCLASRGFKVTDQINNQFVDSLRKICVNPSFGATINAVMNVIDRYPICDLRETFEEKKRKENSTADDDFPIKDRLRIRRILLTPTTIKGIGEEWSEENRVLRQFQSDRFLRIDIRDENLKMLNPSFGLKGPINIIEELLNSGLNIGDRCYRFLGCSNSQLRERGVWMYATDGTNTVESIRRWMGDLSHERCVGTYVARLGQCFSATKNTIEVKNCKIIEDVKNENYTFTDGIGKISVPLAKKVSATLTIGYTPSAFQIRYAGCKGVVSCAPDLGNEEIMQIRPSMKKFESEHKTLEVMATTKPGLLNLNRQVILLLSGLGVPNEAFIGLQENMLKNMVNMLVVEKDAAAAICKSNLGIRLEQLNESGIVVTLEPFLRSVLLILYKQRFNELMTKTRIEIPQEKGRLMMGTIDETGTLSYGEVFVQYSKEIKRPNANKTVHTGPLFIAKNPCLHPGDLRKFTAVDRAELHHMLDCVVFPVKGSRPHPNEMSGSDLDGDMYFVCWDESLIPPGENKDPMDFTPQDKNLLNHDVTEAEMIHFICNYIAGDQLGLIAHAHLAHADAQGISAEECLKLAQMHSDAVDFPKIGKRLRIPVELRPASYPHYMMKYDKPFYTSNHIIGKLYDMCRAIELILTNRSNFSKPTVQIDNDLILPGYEKYLISATKLIEIYVEEMSKLMMISHAESETELLSSVMLKTKQRSGHVKGKDFATSEVIKMKLQSLKKLLNTMFFEEFGGEGCQLSSQDGALHKASALYHLSYSNKKDALGLPWIFWKLLIKIKRMRRNVIPSNVTDGMETKWKSFLHKRSSEVVDISKILDDNVCEDRKKRLTQFSLLIEKTRGAKLILFGSTISTFDSSSSNLDVYIPTINEQSTVDESFHKMVKTISDEIGAICSKQFLQNPKKTIAGLTLPENGKKICLYSSSTCLERTAYIIATIGMNKWMIPALRVVLAWGRNNSIVGEAKECSLKSEEFIMMYIYVIIYQYKYGHLVSKGNINRVLIFLEENHFLNCPFPDCTHIETNTNGEDISFATDVLSNLTFNAESHNTQLEDSEVMHGEVMMQFFSYFGNMQGKAEERLRQIPDLSSADDKRKLIDLKPPQCIQITERMIQAHHSLANSSDIYRFLDLGDIQNGHYSAILPSQVSSQILFKKRDFSSKLQLSTGADTINIRKRKFIEDRRVGLVLEAWGKTSSLLKVMEKIRDIVASSNMFFKSSIPSSRPTIKDSRKVIFENCYGPAAEIRMKPYQGPNQPSHDDYDKHLPRLDKPNISDTFDAEQFSSFFKEQVNFINRFYDKQIHGEFRGVISYGTYYTTNCPKTEFIAKDFDDLANEEHLVENVGFSAHVNGRPARTARRGYKGTGRERDRCQPNEQNIRKLFFRGCFIPTASANLPLFLEHDFIEKGRRQEYRLTIKLNDLRQRVRIDGELVLNKDFEFLQFKLPDEKWLLIDTVRNKTQENEKLKDMRFKLQSRSVANYEELREEPIFKHLLNNCNRLLLRGTSESGVCGVSPEFKDRIKYVRYKDAREFEYRGKENVQSVRDFLHHVTIRVNLGKEFSRPSTDGIFRNVSEDRTEVTVVPELPDLHDVEECDEFIKNIWQFSKELGERLKC